MFMGFLVEGFSCVFLGGVSTFLGSSRVFLEEDLVEDSSRFLREEGVGSCFLEELLRGGSNDTFEKEGIGSGLESTGALVDLVKSDVSLSGYVSVFGYEVFGRLSSKFTD